MKTYGLPINYKEETENGVYIFTIYYINELYYLMNINDIVTFKVGERTRTAQIYQIYYFYNYNKYYCKEVKTNDNVQRNI